MSETKRAIETNMMETKYRISNAKEEVIKYTQLIETLTEQLQSLSDILEVAKNDATEKNYVSIEDVLGFLETPFEELNEKQEEMLTEFNIPFVTKGMSMPLTDSQREIQKITSEGICRVLRLCLNKEGDNNESKK